MADAGSGRDALVQSCVHAQLADYKLTQQEIEEELQKLEEAAKTDKKGWFERTGWPEFLTDRNLAHRAHQARAPGHGENEITLAADLTKQLVGLVGLWPNCT